MASTTAAGLFRARLVAVLTIAYACFILAVTLYPHAVDKGIDPYLERLLDYLHRHGVPDFVDYTFVEVGANVLFFVPIGFLLALLLTLRFSWVAIFLCGAFSAAIETTQKFLIPGRVADVSDVIANSSGGLIGVVLAVLVRLVIRHRDGLVIEDVRAGRRGLDGRVLPARERAPERAPYEQ